MSGHGLKLAEFAYINFCVCGIFLVPRGSKILDAGQTSA